DPGDLPRHADRAAVHGRRAAGGDAQDLGPHRRGVNGGFRCAQPFLRTLRGRRMRIDVSFLPALGAAFMLVFARIGTMIMLLPGLGELSVPVRVRLTVALVLSALMLPLHRAAYQIDLGALTPVLTMLGEELVIGGLLGMTARLTISALQVAGSI